MTRSGILERMVSSTFVFRTPLAALISGEQAAQDFHTTYANSEHARATKQYQTDLAGLRLIKKHRQNEFQRIGRGAIDVVPPPIQRRILKGERNRDLVPTDDYAQTFGVALVGVAIKAVEADLIEQPEGEVAPPWLVTLFGPTRAASFELLNDEFAFGTRVWVEEDGEDRTVLWNRSVAPFIDRFKGRVAHYELPVLATQVATPTQ